MGKRFNSVVLFLAGTCANLFAEVKVCSVEFKAGLFKFAEDIRAGKDIKNVHIQFYLRTSSMQVVGDDLQEALQKLQPNKGIAKMPFSPALKHYLVTGQEGAMLIIIYEWKSAIAYFPAHKVAEGVWQQDISEEAKKKSGTIISKELVGLLGDSVKSKQTSDTPNQ